jgi:hypothetical protein
LVGVIIFGDASTLGFLAGMLLCVDSKVSVVSIAKLILVDKQATNAIAVNNDLFVIYISL